NVGQLRFEKHETQSVLEYLHVGIGARSPESVFANQRLDARDRGVVVTRRGENRSQLLRVLFVEGLAPLQVRGASRRVRRTRQRPAPQVVASRRQQQGLVGVG